MATEQIVFAENEFPVMICGSFADSNEKHPVGMIYPMHFHNEYEFLYVKTGCLHCKTNSDIYIANPGEILFINSRVPHETYAASSETDTVFVQYRQNPSIYGELDYLAEFMRIDDTQCYVFKRNTEACSLLKTSMINISIEGTKKTHAYKHFIFANIHLMTAVLHREKILSDNIESISEKDIKRIIPVLRYVENNCSERISLKAISDILYINPSYFCRIFKNITGGCFTEYLSFVRICKAEKLLKNHSISEAAFAVGFNSLSYFDRVFKKYKFYSPKEYRNLYKPYNNL